MIVLGSFALLNVEDIPACRAYFYRASRCAFRKKSMSQNMYCTKLLPPSEIVAQ